MIHDRARLVLSLLTFILAIATVRGAEPTVAELRERVLKADSPKKKGEAYEAFFVKVGRDGLKELMKDDDPSIAIQSAWQAHAKPIKREPAVRGRADDIYDPEEFKKFVSFLKERGKVDVPEWWASAVVMVDVFPGHHHGFIGPVDERPFSRQERLHKAETEGRAPVVQEKDGTITYSAGGRKLTFPKNVFDGLFGRPVGVIGENHSAVLAFAPGLFTADMGLFPYQAVGFDGRGGKPTWRSTVWGSGEQGPWLNARDRHLDDMTLKDGVVCVFGMSGFTAWAEAFDLATGAVKFRFSSSYWCHWSEAWGLK